MDKKILVTLRMIVRPERRNDLLETMRGMLEPARVERGCLSERVNGFVKLGKHCFNIHEHRGDVRVGPDQSFSNPGLKFELKKLVDAFAAGIDVHFDAVPTRIVGLKRSFGSSDIALLKSGDRVHESWPDCLDAGYLEPRVIRS